MMKRLLCLLTGAAALCLGAQAQTAVKDTAQSHAQRPAQLAGVAAPQTKVSDLSQIEFEYEDVLSLYGEGHQAPVNEGGIAVFQAPCGGANCMEGDGTNGFGFTGRAGGFRGYANFRTGASAATINGLCLLGGYTNGSTNGNDNFNVQYFAYSATTFGPGTSLGGPFTITTASGNAPRALTGGTIAGVLPEWQHRLTHTAVTIPANTCVWVRVSNNSVDAGGLNRTWFWETATGSDGKSISQSVNTTSLNVVANDLAMCVMSASGPIALGDISACPQSFNACTQPSGNCHLRDQSNSDLSTTTFQVIQDNFAAGATGAINTVCFWGGYAGIASPGCTTVPPAADNFTIVIYAHNPGTNGPGTVLGTFNQGTNLTVTRVQTGQTFGVPTGPGTTAQFSEFSYSAVLGSAVNVTNGNCYWIEIRTTNSTGCGWWWEHAFDDGRALFDGASTTSDYAFCVNVALGDSSSACQALGNNCTQPAQNCHGVDTANAFGSSSASPNRDNFRTGAAGAVTQICWWGAYFDGLGGCGTTPTDAFVVKYYNHNATTGLPGSQIASFSGAGLTVARQATGNLIAAVLPEFNYVGTHAAVNLAANTCYWVEITNDPTGPGTCAWFWETGFGGDNRSLGDFLLLPNDLAFCVNSGMDSANETLCSPTAHDNCNESGARCQSRDINDAALSSGDTTTADDFTPAASGNITKICWWGGYDTCTGPDLFRVTYFNQGLNALPGAQIAQFTQGVNLTVTGPASSGEDIGQALIGQGYVGTHAAVPVVAGQCYWVEITNLGVGASCGWFWQNGQPDTGRIAQNDGTGYALFQGNQAFCVNVDLGDAGVCVRAEGGCCLPDGTCTIETQAQCGALGGTYRGDDTFCDVVIATSAPNLAIPDNTPAGADDTITIPVPAGFVLSDLNVGVLVQHTYQGDIAIKLTGPNATQITLMNQPGGGGFANDNLGNPGTGELFIFDDQAAQIYNNPPLASSQPNPVGTWLPDPGPLSTFNGVNSAGNWVLNISDNFADDTGTLIAWRLFLGGANPCPQPAPQACCNGGTCTVVLPAACTTGGGVPQGVGSTCTPSPCVVAPGRCCFASGICQIKTAADCATAGGVAGAANSTCTPNPCSCVLGDANCDGVVNNFDIDAFVLVILNNGSASVPGGFPTPISPAGATAQDCWDLRGCTCNTDHSNEPVGNHVTNFDIDPFVACIVGSFSPCP